MRIIHFISGLRSGGTEKNLFKVIKNKNTEDIIFSFKNYNFYFKKFKIKIYFPKNNSLYSILKHIFFIPAILIKEKPKLIYCWMNHANVVGGLISYLMGFKNIIWNIRSSGDEFKFFKKNYLLFKILILMSYLIPKKTIFNSSYSLSNHKKKFFNKKNNELIYNGFEKKKIINKRKNKNIKFLCVARNHHIKNHEMLLNSFLKFNKKFQNWNLTLVGRGIFLFKYKIKNLKKYEPIINKISFYDETKNLHKFYKSTHFHVLSSNAESFPNVIGESMSYGIPNIATNVGDVGKLILDRKLLIKTNNSMQFSNSLFYASKLFFNRNKYVSYSKKNRDFIEKNFSILKMIKKFKSIEKSFLEYNK